MNSSDFGRFGWGIRVAGSATLGVVPHFPGEFTAQEAVVVVRSTRGEDIEHIAQEARGGGTTGRRRSHPPAHFPVVS